MHHTHYYMPDVFHSRYSSPLSVCPNEDMTSLAHALWMQINEFSTEYASIIILLRGHVYVPVP